MNEPLRALPTDDELDAFAIEQASALETGPTFTTSHGAFRATWGMPVYVQIDLDRFADHRDELTAEVVVRSTVPGLSRQFAQRRLPLLGTRSVPDLAKYLNSRRTAPKVDWAALLDESFTRAVHAHREGEPAIRLDQRPERASNELYALPPAALLHELTVVYGKPGEGKTWWGLAVACAIQTGRSDIVGLAPLRPMNVLILDWEDDEHVKGKRLDMISGFGAPVTYLACRRAIWDELDRILTTIREHSIEFVLIDSVGMACGGIPPESSEAALRFGLAYRQLGLGGVAIAHLPKDAKDESMPFGSVFWQAQARLTWLVKQESDLGAAGFTMGLFCKKSNNDQRPLPMAYDLTFVGDGVAFKRRDIRDTAELAAHTPVKWRMLSALKSGPQTYTQLAADLGESPDTIRMAAKRDPKRFAVAPGQDGVIRVGLLYQGGAPA